MAVKPIPEGYSPVTPYLILRNVDTMLNFVQAAFGATVVAVHRDSGGRVAHADVTIDGAHVMMGGANDQWSEKLGSIHRRREHASVWIPRRREVGAKPRRPADRFHTR